MKRERVGREEKGLKESEVKDNRSAVGSEEELEKVWKKVRGWRQ